MKFTVKDKNNKKIYTGTKQECMHFIKRRAYSRQEITLEEFDDTPAPHYTVPVTAESPPPTKSFFKRIFS
jgi:hypothetical protein